MNPTKANPRTHRCSATLDYSRVDSGSITCTECGREWRLMVKEGRNGGEFANWVPSPCPGCSRTGGYCSCRSRKW